MPKENIKRVRKDVILIENVKVYAEENKFNDKLYYRSVVKIPNIINEGDYDMILIPK